MVFFLEEKPEFYPPPTDLNSHVPDIATYERLHKESLENPDKFWKRYTDQLYFKQKSGRGLEYNYDHTKGPIKISFMEGSTTNIAYNCLERNIDLGYGDKVAYFWEGNSTEDSTVVTYNELLEEVKTMAAVLRNLGVEKGDRVIMYLPMLLELPIAMLACARIGAVHSVVFAGFSAKALADRIVDCKARLIITCDCYCRGPRIFDAKKVVDETIGICKDRVETVLVIENLERSTKPPKAAVPPPPKSDVYWATADCAWITGHTYILYGPLLNGLTSVIFEGLPSYPMPDRYWRVAEKYRVTKLYTSPTAVRSLMVYNESLVLSRDLSSLKVIGTVGEPIDAAAWKWLFEKVGRGKCAIVDTYWQTETGGHVIAPQPEAFEMKPSSASLPAFGIDIAILDEDGKEINEPNRQGSLCIKRAWPGQMRGIVGKDDLFKNTYFPRPGLYFTGDGAYRDEDGYVYLTGRIDDLMNVSGHLLSTSEIESSLTKDSRVVEAAVVGAAHAIKGTTPYAFVTLQKGLKLDDKMVAELKALVRKEIGPIGVPEEIQEAPKLPKTRSGKITRRLLRKVADGEKESLGDMSTLLDPSVVDFLFANRRQHA